MKGTVSIRTAISILRMVLMTQRLTLEERRDTEDAIDLLVAIR